MLGVWKSKKVLPLQHEGNAFYLVHKFVVHKFVYHHHAQRNRPQQVAA